MCYQALHLYAFPGSEITRLPVEVILGQPPAALDNQRYSMTVAGIFFSKPLELDATA